MRQCEPLELKPQIALRLMKESENRGIEHSGKTQAFALCATHSLYSLFADSLVLRFLFFLALVCSCSHPPHLAPVETEPVETEPVETKLVLPRMALLEPDQFPHFLDDLGRSSLKNAVGQSLTALQKKNIADTLSFGDAHIPI